MGADPRTDPAADARAHLRAIGRVMIDEGLTWGNAGNLSARLSGDRFLVTASGTRLGELGDDDFIACDVRGAGGTARGGPRPSKEVPMHRAAYAARPEIGAVLHGAPFHATLLACAAETDVPNGLFVESMYYLERVGRVPYHHPGSEALGWAVGERAAGADVLLLDNHGVLVLGADAGEALQALQVLEMACRMVVTARAAGLGLTPLPHGTVRDFLDHAGYGPRRRTE